MQTYSLAKYMGKEEMYVDTVRLCGEFDSAQKPCPKVSILFRMMVICSYNLNFLTRVLI